MLRFIRTRSRGDLQEITVWTNILGFMFRRRCHNSNGLPVSALQWCAGIGLVAAFLPVARCAVGLLRTAACAVRWRWLLALARRNSKCMTSATIAII